MGTISLKRVVIIAITEAAVLGHIAITLKSGNATSDGNSIDDNDNNRTRFSCSIFSVIDSWSSSRVEATFAMPKNVPQKIVVVCQKVRRSSDKQFRTTWVNRNQQDVDQNCRDACL